MFENDPNAPTGELLTQIKRACLQNTSGNIDQMSLIMPPMSALLVKMSEEASKTADKNIRIQNKMIILTGIILAISIAQLSMTFYSNSHEVTIKKSNIIKSEYKETEPNNITKFKKDLKTRKLENMEPIADIKELTKSKTVDFSEEKEKVEITIMPLVQGKAEMKNIDEKAPIAR